MAAIMPIDERDAPAICELFEQAAACMLENPLRTGCCVHLPARGRLIATGDLHDNPMHFRKIIASADLGAGSDHHVILHELIHGERLINGMDFSHRLLIKVAQHVVAYPQQVHPLLANHELSQYTGRPVSKGQGNAVLQFDDALDYVFGDDAGSVRDAMRVFFRAMPLALKTQSGILCAHSLPNARMMGSFDHDVLDRALDEDDYHPPAGAAYLMTWGRAFKQGAIDQIAQQWGVELFILGHQHVETGAELHMERMVVLNSDHDRAVLLPLDLSADLDAHAMLEQVVPLAAIGLE